MTKTTIQLEATKGRSSTEKIISVYPIETTKTLIELLVRMVVFLNRIHPCYIPDSYLLTTPIRRLLQDSDSLETDLGKTLEELKMSKGGRLEGIYYKSGDYGKIISKIDQAPDLDPTIYNLLLPRNLLNYAVKTGNIKLVQAFSEIKVLNSPSLLERGTRKLESVMPPLMTAVLLNKTEVVKTLLDQLKPRDRADKINLTFNGINTLGLASLSKEDASQISFMLLAEGAIFDTPVGLCVYTNSHLNVIKLFKEGGIEPNEEIKDVDNYRPQTEYYKVLKNKVSSSPSKTKLPIDISEKDESYVRYLQSFSTFNLFFPSSIILIILMYIQITYEEHYEIIRSGKEKILEPISNYLSEENAEPDHWLRHLLNVLIRPYPLWTFVPTDRWYVSNIIYQHVERYSAHTGKLLEEDSRCFKLLLEYINKESLQHAGENGLQRHMNFNPIGSCLIWKENKNKQIVVELSEKPLQASGRSL